MIEQLYVNGDSWTYGNGIEEDPLLAHIPVFQRYNITRDYVWSTVLANKMNVPLINDAMGGGSNERIVRTTCEFLMNYPKEKYKDLFVVLGWTVAHRREFFLRENSLGDGDWGRFNVNQTVVAYESDKYSEFFITQVEKWHKDYTKYIFDYRAAYVTFFQQVYLMSNLLENLGIRYLFFNSMHWKHFEKGDHIFHHPCIDFADTIAKLKKPQILMTADRDDSLNIMAQFCETKNLPMTKDNGHTMVDGHRQWAEHLYSEIKVHEGSITC